MKSGQTMNTSEQITNISAAQNKYPGNSLILPKSNFKICTSVNYSITGGGGGGGGGAA